MRALGECPRREDKGKERRCERISIAKFVPSEWWGGWIFTPLSQGWPGRWVSEQIICTHYVWGFGHLWGEIIN